MAWVRYAVIWFRPKILWGSADSPALRLPAVPDPKLQFYKRDLRMRCWILPVAVRGISVSSMKAMDLGRL